MSKLTQKIFAIPGILEVNGMMSQILLEENCDTPYCFFPVTGNIPFKKYFFPLFLFPMPTNDNNILQKVFCHEK